MEIRKTKLYRRLLQEALKLGMSPYREDDLANEIMLALYQLILNQPEKFCCDEKVQEEYLQKLVDDEEFLKEEITEFPRLWWLYQLNYVLALPDRTTFWYFSNPKQLFEIDENEVCYTLRDKFFLKRIIISKKQEWYI